MRHDASPATIPTIHLVDVAVRSFDVSAMLVPLFSRGTLTDVILPGPFSFSPNVFYVSPPPKVATVMHMAPGAMHFNSESRRFELGQRTQVN